MSQSSFSKRTSLWHALSCLYSGTDTSNSPADLDRAAMSFSMAAMLFCCWPEKKKRSQPGIVCQGHVSYPSDGSIPAAVQWGQESHCCRGQTLSGAGAAALPQPPCVAAPCARGRGRPGSASRDSGSPGILPFLTLFKDL